MSVPLGIALFFISGVFFLLAFQLFGRKLIQYELTADALVVRLFTFRFVVLPVAKIESVERLAFRDLLLCQFGCLWLANKIVFAEGILVVGRNGLKILMTPQDISSFLSKLVTLIYPEKSGTRD